MLALCQHNTLAYYAFMLFIMLAYLTQAHVHVSVGEICTVDDSSEVYC